MNNLTRGQTIFIGVAALFGVPICIGLVVGHFAGFWIGLLSTVIAIAVIAAIAQRWWQRQQKQNKDKGN